MTQTKIIDAHCHIYPDKIAKKAVSSVGLFYNLDMLNDGTANALKASCAASNVSHCVVCSVATRPEQVESINNFILQQVNLNPKLFTGLITLHPDMPACQIDAAIDFAINSNLKGIKLHPDFQKFDIDSPKALTIYERAQGVLPILFHTGDSRYTFSKPDKLASVLRQFKNLTAIAAHFGGYSRWDEIDCYLDTPNVYFDTCSSLFTLSAQKAKSIINKFGAHRFMFGTDYPMWQQKTEIERLENLHLTKEQYSQILFENAKRVYNINI